MGRWEWEWGWESERREENYTLQKSAHVRNGVGKQARPLKKRGTACCLYQRLSTSGYGLGWNGGYTCPEGSEPQYNSISHASFSFVCLVTFLPVFAALPGPDSGFGFGVL